MSFVPRNSDAQLLFLRLGFGIPIFIKHGWEKLARFSIIAPTYSDPLHIGSRNSLIFAMLSDSICSLLIMLGVGTRWASLFSCGVLFTAWAFKYHFLFWGHYTADHGELCVLYIVAMLALLIGGAGRYSIDALLKDKSAARDR